MHFVNSRGEDVVIGTNREKVLFVIKPSGVDYDKFLPEDLVVMDLKVKAFGLCAANIEAQTLALIDKTKG